MNGNEYRNSNETTKEDRPYRSPNVTNFRDNTLCLESPPLLLGEQKVCKSQSESKQNASSLAWFREAWLGTLKEKKKKNHPCCSLEQPCPGLAHFQVPAKPKETSGLRAALGHPEKGQPALGMWPRLCPSGHFSRAQNNFSKAQVGPSHRNKLNQKHKNKSQA